MVVGARSDRLDATDIDGDENNNNLSNTGAVYIYNFNPLIFLNGFESIAG